VFVWHAPPKGGNCNAVWAPELHWINGRWFIYYAADNGENENHCMWALESEGSDHKAVSMPRAIATGGWAIDGTVLTMEDGRLFFIWSGWPGRENGQQNLYAAAMRDPLTLAAQECCSAFPINHGNARPCRLRRAADLETQRQTIPHLLCQRKLDGRLLLGDVDQPIRDVLNPAAWEKRGPVFQKTDTVWGWVIAHSSLRLAKRKIGFCTIRRAAKARLD